MPPKDWTQRFEKAEQKPRVGRLVFGILILLSKASHFIAVNPDQPKGIMGLLDLWPPTNAEAIGYDLGSTLLWLVALWLIVTGVQPKAVTLPPEPK
jgi:hypothetical protein